jgi:hypothetical protein
MLERWCKNQYFGGSFSLSGSFWSKMVQIGRLTSRARQSALETATTRQSRQ